MLKMIVMQATSKPLISLSFYFEPHKSRCNSFYLQLVLLLWWLCPLECLVELELKARQSSICKSARMLSYLFIFLELLFWILKCLLFLDSYMLYLFSMSNMALSCLWRQPIRILFSSFLMPTNFYFYAKVTHV